MAKNSFFTILVVPEKTSAIRRLVVPAWLVRTSVIGLFFGIVLCVVMLFNYSYVMNQIAENKQLKMDNRRLKQQVQIFQNKMTTVEGTMDRIKNFATRLKVITNIEDREDSGHGASIDPRRFRPEELSLPASRTNITKIGTQKNGIGS